MMIVWKTVVMTRGGDDDGKTKSKRESKEISGRESECVRTVRKTCDGARDYDTSGKLILFVAVI